jgi:UDP-N-acetylglucosamine 2-epimerase (non-hydrolysing)
LRPNFVLMKKVLIIVGTRPNFIKVTQFKRVAAQYDDIDLKILHTGQHYDNKMSGIFFEQFGLKPDFFLNIDPATANTQMATIMIKLETVVGEFNPDLMIVVGDVNSTFAAALTANKLGVKIAHLESGLRSRDRGMPEEINRLLTDEISDYFFVTEQSGLDNLKSEGKQTQSTFFVGNTMIDTMVAFEENIENSDVMDQYGLKSGEYILMTIHRPATVDNVEGLTKLIELIEELTKNKQIVFPIHPRTVSRLASFGLEERLRSNEKLILTEPMGYFSFQKLIKYAALILTDSGGIQEETTFRQVPCLTLRPNTERPSTLTIGSNELITFDIDLIKSKIKDIETGSFKKGQVPELWDGKSTERIMKHIHQELNA